VVEVDHLEVARRAVAELPVRYSGMPGYRYEPAPCMGQHRREVLREPLDIDDREFEDLVERRVVF
jgi:crotonobetainyl-CoA:carnitine CoA-transferase CaiB-like acyl-CoA transferase